MKKSTIIALTSSLLLLIVGAIIFALGILKEDTKFFTNVYDYSDSTINNFDIDLETSDLFFVLSNDNTNKIVVQEKEDKEHNVSLENGTLMIEEPLNDNWYKNIFSLNFKSPSVYVYLNSDSFKDLNVKITTGDINIPNNFTFDNAIVESTTGSVAFSAHVIQEASFKVTTGKINIRNIDSKELTAKSTTGDIELFNCTIENSIVLEASTGDIELDDVKANSLKTTSTTGDVELNNTIINSETTIQTTTGEVELKNSDSNTINIKTTTGDVEGSLLSGKTFDIDTATGDVRVPYSSIGGLCKIETSTGDIKIVIK